jgi:5-methyltetrahydropteroyltriglutamate--homocysteine methyltransferase
MRDRNQKDLELFEPFKHDLKKKICLGAVSHRTLQADRPEEVANEIRKALKYIPVERLIVSSDCGFGRQGCTREIAFYKASAIAQGCNIIRRELGLPVTYVPAADPRLQVDVVPGRDVAPIGLSASKH